MARLQHPASCFFLCHVCTIAGSLNVEGGCLHCLHVLNPVACFISSEAPLQCTNACHCSAMPSGPVAAARQEKGAGDTAAQPCECGSVPEAGRGRQVQRLPRARKTTSYLCSPLGHCVSSRETTGLPAHAGGTAGGRCCSLLNILISQKQTNDATQAAKCARASSQHEARSRHHPQPHIVAVARLKSLCSGYPVVWRTWPCQTKHTTTNVAQLSSRELKKALEDPP